LSNHTRIFALAVSLVALVDIVACGADNSTPSHGNLGGAAGSGGVSSTGGAAGSGGIGGTSGNGGAAGSGGVTITGGAAGSGGVAGAGGQTPDGGGLVDSGPRVDGASDASADRGETGTAASTGVVGRLFVGYQGWFFATGDGSTRNMWTHWSKSGVPAPGNVNYEVYPDIREYTKLYATSLAAFQNGTAAKLFSSYNAETVNKHFEWMRDYGIPGAALQRFGADSKDTAWKEGRDQVAVNVRNAAEAYGRNVYVMYDISNMNATG
jgi:hypothetical protein